MGCREAKKASHKNKGYNKSSIWNKAIVAVLNPEENDIDKELNSISFHD